MSSEEAGVGGSFARGMARLILPRVLVCCTKMSTFNEESCRGLVMDELFQGPHAAIFLKSIDGGGGRG